MKTKLLTGLFLLTVFFTFSSCEKELQEEAIQEKVKTNSETEIVGNVNYVTIEDVPFLKPTVKKFQAKNKLTARAVEPALELDRIAEYEGADGYVSYSIAIEQPPVESSDYYFENLNIIKSGDQYETFIIRYNPDNDTQYLDFSNFTGTTEFFTNEYKPVSTIAFQGSTARRVDVAPAPPVENTGSGGGCSCSASLVEKLFNWIRDAINSVGYAISNISITAYSNAGNNGYDYNPYVIVVTPPDMGTSNNTNYPDPSGGSSTIIVSPNEPEWTPTNSQSIMAKRLCRRINFDDLSVRDWLLDPSNVESVKGFYFVLWEENSLENQLFVKQAVESVRMGAEVDLAYKVIVDQSFKNNPCLNGVYTHLGKAATFQSYLQKFDGSFSVANLRFSVGIDPDIKLAKANAVTYQPNNYLINTMFNPTKLNRPQLDIARTFIHELIHAEIYRKLLSVAGQPNIPWTYEFIKSIKDDYPGLYDYYLRYICKIPVGQRVTDEQHELMAQHYRDIIIQVLKQFDNTQTSETYNALACRGLMGDGEVDNLTGLPPNPTVAWKNVPQNERLQIISIVNNFINTNTPCQ